MTRRRVVFEGVQKSTDFRGPLVDKQHLQAQQYASDLHQLLIGSSIALAVTTIIAVVLGWLLARRVLRPLRTITNTTRGISEDNLHQRLALPGPRDELTDLGDTIDELLGRMQAAFEAQKSFVANASHELRTPLTLARAAAGRPRRSRHHPRLTARGMSRRPGRRTTAGAAHRRAAHPGPQPTRP